jgi:plasmid stability protein
MADVKIRRLPDWVVDHYKRSAERAGRSLEEELRVLLTEHTAGKRQYWAKRLDKLREKIHRKHGTLPDSVMDMRAERERLG